VAEICVVVSTIRVTMEVCVAWFCTCVSVVAYRTLYSDLYFRKVHCKHGLPNLLKRLYMGWSGKLIKQATINSRGVRINTGWPKKQATTEISISGTTSY